MRLWGLTGGIASGKSSVARLLREQGVPVIDADQLYHDLISPIEGRPSALTRVIAATFGNSLLQEGGLLDRAALGRLVFQDAEVRARLEAMTHPAIRKAAQSAFTALSDADYDLAFYDVPLLYEQKLSSQFEGVLLVWVPKATQLSRMMKRNQMSSFEASERLTSQLSLDWKRSQAQIVIDNSGPLVDLQSAVVTALKDIKNLS